MWPTQGVQQYQTEAHHGIYEDECNNNDDIYDYHDVQCANAYNYDKFTDYMNSLQNTNNNNNSKIDNNTKICSLLDDCSIGISSGCLGADKPANWFAILID